MNRLLLTIGTLFLTVPQLFAWNGDVVVATPNTAMVLHADEGKDLRMD